MSDLVPFQFHDDELLLVEVAGKPHIVLKPAFEAIGVDADRQIKNLRAREWARTSVTAVRDSAGRVQPMVTADVRTFLMALAVIPTGRVAEHVRPKLIAYQSEVADAIEAYWTQGGAINSRATGEQILELGRQLEQQARVLSALKGVVSRDWLEAKGRHLAARALGEEPEIDPLTRPLTVGEYLEAKGISGKALRSLSGQFGKRMKAAYIDRYDREPTVVDRFVDNAMRPVAVYTERQRPLFDRVWRDLAPET